MKNNRIEALLDLINTSPPDPFLHYALATEYLSAGEVKKARSAFEKLLQEHPEYVATYYHYAKLRWAEGDPEEAMIFVRKGIVAAGNAGDHKAKRELNQLLEEMED